MSKRYYLEEDDMWRSVFVDMGEKQSPGCYFLYAEDGTGSAIPIQRMMGIEPTGLLYIGGSDQIANRLGQLRGSCMSVYGVAGGYQGRPHGTGRKMEHIDGFTVRFPWRGLYLQIETCAELSDSKRLSFLNDESRLIEGYRKRWGETPPLNG